MTFGAKSAFPARIDILAPNPDFAPKKHFCGFGSKKHQFDISFHMVWRKLQKLWFCFKISGILKIFKIYSWDVFVRIFTRTFMRILGGNRTVTIFPNGKDYNGEMSQNSWGQDIQRMLGTQKSNIFMCFKLRYLCDYWELEADFFLWIQISFCSVHFWAFSNNSIV